MFSRATGLICVLVLTGWTTACGNDTTSLTARQGLLDLSALDLEHAGPVGLGGQWEFYWERLLEPNDFRQPNLTESPEYFPVPSAWNGREHAGTIIDGAGFATFRLRVRLPNTAEGKTLALRIPEQGTSHRVYANGRLVATNGVVAANPDESRAQFRPLMAALIQTGPEVELIVQIANHADQSGGFWFPILLGTEEQIREGRDRDRITEGILWGALFIMGLYHLALFGLRRRESAALYFGIVCLLMATRMLVTGERILIQSYPDLPFVFFIKLEYLAFYGMLPVFLWFVVKLFPDLTVAWLDRAIVAIGACAVLLVLATSPAWFTRTIVAFQILILLVGTYIYVIGIRGIRHGRPSAISFLVGSTLFFACIVNDILNNLEIIRTGYIAHVGLFLFVFAQSAILAGRFSRAFRRVEELSVELEARNRETEDLNRQLDRKVQERTRQLSVARDRIEQALVEIRKLNEFTRRINETGDLHKVVSLIMGYVEDVYGIDGITIHRVDRSANLMVPIEFSHPDAAPPEVREFARTHSIPLDESGGIVHLTISRKKRFYLSDTSRFVNHPADKMLMKNFQLSSVLLVPLIVQNEVIALVSLTGYKQRMRLKRQDIESIARFCEQIAGAVYSTSLLQEVRREREKSDRLLLNILPVRVADELKSRGEVQPILFDSVTVFFTDFVGFTAIAERTPPADLIRELDGCFTRFDEIVERHGLEKLKTIGDAYMAAGGLPETNATHAVDACLAMLEFQAFMAMMKSSKAGQSLPFWSLRVGVHTGPVTAGVVGKNKFAYDIWGDTVNTASRLESAGSPERVNISEATHRIVRDFFVCEERGKIEAKGKGKIEMFFLNGIRPDLCEPENPLLPNDRFRAMRAELAGAKR